MPLLIIVQFVCGSHFRIDDSQPLIQLRKKCLLDFGKNFCAAVVHHKVNEVPHGDVESHLASYLGDHFALHFGIERRTLKRVSQIRNRRESLDEHREILSYGLAIFALYRNIRQSGCVPFCNGAQLTLLSSSATKVSNNFCSAFAVSCCRSSTSALSTAMRTARAFTSSRAARSDAAISASADFSIFCASSFAWSRRRCASASLSRLASAFIASISLGRLASLASISFFCFSASSRARAPSSIFFAVSSAVARNTGPPYFTAKYPMAPNTIAKFSHRNAQPVGVSAGEFSPF